MTSRIALLCVPATAALRTGRFPANTALDLPDPADLAGLPTLRDPLLAMIGGDSPRVSRSPAPVARATAEALGLEAAADAELREVDYGKWTGQSLKDVAASAPDALAAWLADPAMAGHGGESLLAVASRAARWIDACAPGPTLAVTHASVICALVVHARGAPARAATRLDIAPLTLTTLTGQPGGWRVSTVAVPIQPGG
ncbi:histidine phosphatase family protein [Cupriavidus pauculus]|uniref:Histidine phosphatase family protein n=1 Tax=Cupriavidus pauculus TaxID=82633 RepID=A0A3G8HBX8_9BURK|nr:histidine phosphatase family protein [Cupriavidus pauculus]AZG17122.1 histidine phosphatase family protein [Cupriavidus pauculus]